jgi:hypothetical protein
MPVNACVSSAEAKDKRAARGLHDARRVLLRLLLGRDDDGVRRMLGRTRVPLAERRGVGEGGIDAEQLVGDAEAIEDGDDAPLDVVAAVGGLTRGLGFHEA